jgi:hypothetical protein
LPETADWGLIGELDQYDAEIKEVGVTDEDVSFWGLLLSSDWGVGAGGRVTDAYLEVW